jgi:hypothetical protein
MRTWLICGAILLAATATAESMTVGDPIERFSLEDQHGVVHEVDESTRLILFSRDMEGGKLLKEALAEAPVDFLSDRQAVYLADISGMPKLVATLFALPSMRRRGYPILLDRDGSTSKRLPDVEGSATLIFCEDLVVTRVETAETSEAVAQALAALPARTGD